MSRAYLTLVLLAATMHPVPAANASFTRYPAFGDHANLPPGVEAAEDKGLIVEMIVRCRNGAAIVTYSKVERLFCSPRHACWRRLDQAAAEACGR